MQHWCWLSVDSLDPIDNPDIDGTFELNWSVSCPATSYTLQEARDENFTTGLREISFDAPSASSRDVTAHGGAGLYYYRIKACDEYRCTNWSNVQSVKAWWESEPNDGFKQANGPLLPFMDYYGYPDDTYDCFKIDVQEAGRIAVTLTGHTGVGVQLDIRDKDVDVIESCRAHEPPYELDCELSKAGLYYIYIYTESPHDRPEHYTLTAKFSSMVALNRSRQVCHCFE
jgi:hypothetical protein